jgi:poly-D-alanine transfer protein DltD
MYPKTIKLQDPKLQNLLTAKGELIKSGIEISKEIEVIEQAMNEVDLKVQEVEKSVDISDLLEKEQAVTAYVEKCIKDMEAIKREIFDRMKAKTPKELYEKYEALTEEKKQKEEARNKLALKAQKYTDKIKPIGKRLLSPFLTTRGDDYDSIKLENGEIVCTVFNHFDEYEKLYKKKYGK